MIDNKIKDESLLNNNNVQVENHKNDNSIKKRQEKKKIKIKFRHKHPIIFSLLVIFSTLFVLVTSTGIWFIEDTLDNAPKITEQMLKSDGTSNMYDANGNIIWSSTEIRRDYINSSDIPSTYIDMLLSVEDSTYKEHIGVSKKGVINMFITPILSKIPGLNIQARGGSSIEQQLIKQTAFDTTNEDFISTLKRKIVEVWLSLQLDQNFTKDEILEFYVNKIFLGENSYGINTISITYFGQPISNFSDSTPENLSKVAIIAGLGQAPSNYNLYDNPEAVRIRRNEVLLSAFNNNKITEAQYKAVLKVDVLQDLQPRFWRNEIVQAQVSKYNAYISATMNQISKLGYDLNKSPLQIYTHLQPDQYEWLTDVVNNSYYKDDLHQVAVTVTDTKTGVVIAQSGGRFETANGINRAIQTTRSSGSGMKPFIVYGPLIEYFGYASNSLWDSSPYVYPGTDFVATNYGGASYGMVTMQYALAMSLNTPVTRGLDNVVGSSYAKEFLSGIGLDVKESYGGSDALGLDVSTEMTAAAYAAIANNGVYNSPQYISKLVFSDGSERQIVGENHKGMEPSTAFILAKMLKTTTNPGFSAQRASLNQFPGYIVKTGMTNYDESYGWDDVTPDSWISGATKSVAVSIWTGYDSPNEYGHWISTLDTTKYELFREIMLHYNEGKDTSDWNMPENVIDLGNGYYQAYPEKDIVASPATFDVVDNSNIVNSNKYFNNKIQIEQEKIESDVPADYKIGDWINNLSENDKKIYDFYKQKNGSLPTVKDISTEKVFDNSTNRN